MPRVSGRREVLGFVLACVLRGVGRAAAQPAGGPGPMGPGHPGSGWSASVYLDSLKSRLGITATQEPAWQHYADAVQAEREQMRALHEQMFEQMDSANEADRKAVIDRMIQARAQAYGAVRAAAQALLPQLTPDQQATAQEILPGLARSPGMPGGHPSVAVPR